MNSRCAFHRRLAYGFPGALRVGRRHNPPAQQLRMRLEQLLQLRFVVCLHFLENRQLPSRLGDDDLASHGLNHAISAADGRSVAADRSALLQRPAASLSALVAELARRLATSSPASHAVRATRSSRRCRSACESRCLPDSDEPSRLAPHSKFALAQEQTES